MRPARSALVTLFLGTACGDPVGPDRGDPALFAFTEPVSFACGNWSPALPSVALGLFDVFFPGQRAGPGDDAVRQLVRLGGTVVYRYHVNAVRAILPPGVVPQLRPVVARGVLDLGDLSVKVFVGFKDAPAPWLLTDLGGTIMWVSSLRPASVAGIVPDPGIPILRQDSRVRYVESSEGGVCFDG